MARNTPLSERFTEEQLSEICDLYLSGVNAETAGQPFGVSGTAVRTLVKRRGLTVRASGTRRTHTVDDGFFDSIDSEPKAYWLGFLAADGGVYGNRVEVGLARKDREHLDRLKLALRTDYPIRDRLKRPRGYEAGFPSSRLALVSRQMVDGLARHGVRPRKTFTHEWPDFLPPVLLRHYLRGYVDGDGGFYASSSGNRKAHYAPNLVFSFIATHAFCEGARTYLIANAGCNPKVKVRTHSASDMGILHYGGVLQVSRIYSLLYGDATVWLPRKRDSVRDYIRAERLNWADNRH